PLTCSSGASADLWPAGRCHCPRNGLISCSALPGRSELLHAWACGWTRCPQALERPRRGPGSEPCCLGAAASSIWLVRRHPGPPLSA
ncbi:unnamed protein product, partial [Polarella glacialis]